MRNRKAKKKWTLAFDESGAIAAVSAIIFATLCGVVGLAVDFGHYYKVRAELQRTADAGALAGASRLTPYKEIVPIPIPYWSNGRDAANFIISNDANKVGNPKVTPDSTVVGGYWLLKPASGDTQLDTTRPGAAKLGHPAIKVTLSKDVTMYLAPVIKFFGPLRATATAIAVLPEGYSIAKNIAPLAVERTSIIYDSDHTINTEVLIGLTGRVTGQWFTLHGANDVPTIRINEPMTAKTQQVYITPGTEATVYQNMVDMGVIVPGESMIVPVVEIIDKTIEKTYEDILGFAEFFVTAVDKSKKTISGRYMETTMTPNANSGTGAGGTYYGVSGTPKLVGP